MISSLTIKKTFLNKNDFKQRLKRFQMKIENESKNKFTLYYFDKVIICNMKGI